MGERGRSHALLRTQLDEAYERIRATVVDLTDDEFFWEPVPGCWTVREDADGRWAADYPDLPHPQPAPFTTIAWRLVHVAESKLMYHEYAFGAARLVWPQINSTHTAADAISSLEKWHALLRADLDALDEAGLEKPVKTNWGEDWPAWQIFWTMIDHDLHHQAEIATLRDLYRLSGGRSLIQDG